MRFVPAWFPFATFKREAARHRALFSKVDTAPHEWAKKQMVCCSFPHISLYHVLGGRVVGGADGWIGDRGLRGVVHVDAFASRVGGRAGSGGGGYGQVVQCGAVCGRGGHGAYVVCGKDVRTEQGVVRSLV